MPKTILITGSTDGIGLCSAQILASQGHTVLLHGRSAEKLAHAKEVIQTETPNAKVNTYLADLSSLTQTKALATQLIEQEKSIDILINNAGIFAANSILTEDGYELRFAVNAIAPYALSALLAPAMPNTGRIINLSSAAQASVDLKLITQAGLADGAAYAQSKLLLTMWSRYQGLANKESGPSIIALNPKSFLGSKMVKEAYGVAGGDIREGAEIIVRAAISEEFGEASGMYFDNDIGRFSNPHEDALNEQKVQNIINWLEGEIRPRLS